MLTSLTQGLESAAVCNHANFTSVDKFSIISTSKQIVSIYWENYNLDKSNKNIEYNKYFSQELQFK